MCSVCGCGDIESHVHEFDHSHSRPHTHAASALQPHNPKHATLSGARIVELEQDILAQNSRYAEANRAWLAARKILAINIVSSPGSGKTSLLTRTITALGTQYKVAVIEGDQQTDNDAQRIRAAGADALQINTGRGCHLDAHMVGHAFEGLNLTADSIAFIENVGNLICPALFKLGERFTVVVLSVTEGEDKPLKYPDMFANADVLLLNKIDLLPYLDFDIELCMEYARRINPKITIFQLSAKTGAGMQSWYAWLEQHYRTR